MIVHRITLFLMVVISHMQQWFDNQAPWVILDKLELREELTKCAYIIQSVLRLGKLIVT